LFLVRTRPNRWRFVTLGRIIPKAAICTTAKACRQHPSARIGEAKVESAGGNFGFARFYRFDQAECSAMRSRRWPIWGWWFRQVVIEFIAHVHHLMLQDGRAFLGGKVTAHTFTFWWSWSPATHDARFRPAPARNTACSIIHGSPALALCRPSARHYSRSL